MKKTHQVKTRLMIIVGIFFVLISIGSLFGFGWPLLQVKAGPTLPPRDVSTPTTPSDDDDDDAPVGA